MYQTEETKVGGPPGHEPRYITEDPSQVPAETEIRSSRFHQAVLAEWVGTIFLVFFLVLTFMSGAEVMRTALVAGSTYSVLVYMFYGTSGAHFNPAVTLGVLAARRTTPLRAAFYLIAQVIGAITGAGLARSISISQFNAIKGGANRLPHGVSPGSGFWLEILGTTFFVLAYLSATDTKSLYRWPHKRVLVPLQVGLALFIAHLTLLPYTFCSTNPARSVGTSIVANYWNHHWVFWFAPLIGGLLAPTLYALVFFFSEEPPEKDLEAGSIFGGTTTTGTNTGTAQRGTGGMTGSGSGI